MTTKRRGRQTPTVGFTLPYNESKGDKAIALYNMTGRTAQEWQELLLTDMLAINEDGLWVHTRYGYSVPRQNGKNEVIAMRELYGLTQGERILHTAHRTSTSRSAWERLIYLLESLGIKEKSAANPDGYVSGKSKGQEFIFLSEADGGGRIQFRTRTTTGGLGETFDLLIIDEAQEYQDDQESALKYTIVSSENPQTILLGTPPTPYSSGTIFPKFRQKVLSGEMKNGAWAEWSVEEETDPNDVEAWYETNPSLGYKLTERAIEDEIGSDTVDFNIQRLGLWIRHNQKSAISKVEWDRLYLPKFPKLHGRLAVGIKYGKDGKNVSMSIACKSGNDRIFVECIGCKDIREGNAWIVNFLTKLGDNCFKVVVDGASGQSILAEEMKAKKLKAPIMPSTVEFIQANSKFERNIYNLKLCHMGQQGLTDIVTNCEKRAIGSAGGFGYRSMILGADISLLDSVILASWAIENFEQTVKKVKVSY